MIALQRIELAGTRYIVLQESEYERLCREASAAADHDDGPPFPEPDKDGNFEAQEFSRVCIARSLVRDRKAVGLTQQRLATLAHVRQETISRLESGKHVASIPTLEKIDRAIEAERKRLQKRNGKS
jgi:DNA-binding XRE family transcriptional regulator